MGIYLELVDHEQEWRNNTSPRKIVVNDLDVRTSDQKDEVNNTIFTTNQADGVYSSVPACQCGERTGRHRIGSICNNCNTAVEEPIQEYLQPMVWLRSPDGVAPLVNPIIWYMLRREFSIAGYGKFDTISYLTNTSYRSDISTTEKMRKLFQCLDEANLHIRGYNHFIKHFDEYMEFLFTCPVFKRKNDDKSSLYYLIQSNKDKIFTSHLPLPNRSLLIIEKTRYSTYIDESLTTIIEAARILTGIDFPEAIPQSDRVKQNKTSRCMALVSHYYKEYYREYLTPKEALIRRNVISGRKDYTARCVISSIPGEHRFDEIHVPWATSINWLRNHIYSKCLHRGMSPNQTFDFVNKYNKEYHPVMHEIINELIQEAGPRGIPVLGNRNPSLGRNSIQRVFFTKVKTDVDDITISLSVLICPNWNADSNDTFN